MQKGAVRETGPVAVLLFKNNCVLGFIICETCIRWIQEGFKAGFLQKHPNPVRIPFFGRFGSDSGVLQAVTVISGL